MSHVQVSSVPKLRSVFTLNVVHCFAFVSKKKNPLCKILPFSFNKTQCLDDDKSVFDVIDHVLNKLHDNVL